MGYDTKIISEDDFNNEKADTGELGSNLCITALYEIKRANFGLPGVDGADAKLADIEVRYKDVRGTEEVNDSVTSAAYLVASSTDSDDLSFISCVAEFGLILRNSAYKGTSSIANVLERLDELTEYISGDIYKQEFVTLVGKASESGHYN